MNGISRKAASTVADFSLALALTSDEARGQSTAAGPAPKMAEEVFNVTIIDLKTLEVTGSIFTGDAPEAMAWAERR
jgi:hypothetical protein